MTFVKSRGNIREMERELDISYWTIRRMIDDLIEELGLEAKPAEDTETELHMREILDQVNRGELDADEAADLLSQLERP